MKLAAVPIALALMCYGSSAVFAAGRIVYSENFNALGFRGAYEGEYTNEKWPITYTYYTSNYDSWVFTGGAYYTTNAAGTDGAIWLNEVPANASASTTVHGLTAGARYKLSFNEWGDNEPGGSYILTVALNGTQVLEYHGVDGPAGSLPAGRSFSVPFTATSSEEKLYFAQIYQSAASPLIDNVQITTVEPAGSSHAGLVADGTGALYGVTASGGVAKDGCCGTVFRLAPPASGKGAWTKTVLYAFTGKTDGKTPNAGLMVGGDGGLYGTTEYGGVQDEFGVVYELTPPTGTGTAWTETVLYSFAGGADGYIPDGGLTLGLDGVTLYGVTYRGGTGACKSPSGSTTGCGTVFSLTPPVSGQTGWTKTLLYDFQGPDGQYPTSGVWSDSAGALYGTTTYGGSGTCSFVGTTKRAGCGVVFKLTPPASGHTEWTESTLYSFTGNKFGSYPRTALVGDSAGNLYGTSETTTGQGSGIVFELRPPYASKTTWTMYLRGQVPHYGAPFGETPAAGDLAIGSDGTLYGAASTGGDLSGCGGLGCGTAFSLQPPPKGSSSLAPWTLTTLYDFAGGDSASGDGALPHWGLVLGSGGVVSGVTGAGGTGTCGTAVGCGTVFQLTPPAAGSTGWTEAVQYRFQGWQDGYAP